MTSRTRALARTRGRSAGQALGTWLLGLMLAAGSACAQQTIQVFPGPEPQTPQGITRPGASSRIVRTFDFEEQSRNPGEVPEHWFRAQDSSARPRPGFPAWNKADLRYTNEGGMAAAGVGAVRLPTIGGSTSLVLGQGVIPVFQNADYLLSAKVRTEKLTHARAVMVARFLDGSGHPIPNSDVRSGLVLSNDAWTSVAIELVGEHDRAAYIQLELQLLQPEQQHPGEQSPKDKIWSQDFAGATWWDDVSVVQLPRVELTTSSISNIIAKPDEPELKMLVRDLTGEELSLRLEVLDVNGLVADRLERKVGAGFTTTTWKPALTKMGWYRATLEITTESGSRVGRTFTDFVWIPGIAVQAAGNFTGDAVAISDRARFGVVLEHLPEALLPRIPDLMRRIGAGSITLPAWDRSLTLEQVNQRADAFRPVVDGLIADRRQVMFSLARVPESLAGRMQLEADDPWSLLLADQKAWMPFLMPMLEQYGQRINHWQIGEAGDDRALWRTEADPEAQVIAQKLAHLVPGVVLGVPTRLGTQWTAPRPSSDGLGPMIVQSVPMDATPQAVGLSVRSAAPFVESGAGELALVMEGLPAARYGTAAGGTEAVKRAIEFWAASSGEHGRLLPGVSLSLEDPWEWKSQGRRSQLMPRPEVAVWRSLLDRLAGRRVAGVFPATGGTVCYVLAPAPGSGHSRGGALVAWNESAQSTTLTGDFGSDPLRVVDIFGNATPLAKSVLKKGSRPVVQVPLSGTPVFIEGVDVDLVRFIASFAIEPSFLESSNEQHEREMVISNPWETVISGQITILEPGGFESGAKDRAWRISPRSQRFSVPAGKSERLPLKIAFSPVEEVGPKNFVVAIELTADKPYGTIEIHRTLEVSVRDIAVDLTCTTQGADNADLNIESLVSNTGKNPLTLEITAFAEGFPRSKASVTDLAAGNQTIRRFLYPGGAAKLKGQRVMVSVFDPETGARVNKSITVP